MDTRIHLWFSHIMRLDYQCVINVWSMWCGKFAGFVRSLRGAAYTARFLGPTGVLNIGHTGRQKGGRDWPLTLLGLPNSFRQILEACLRRTIRAGSAINAHFGQGRHARWRQEESKPLTRAPTALKASEGQMSLKWGTKDGQGTTIDYIEAQPGQHFRLTDPFPVSPHTRRICSGQ